MPSLELAPSGKTTRSQHLRCGPRINTRPKRSNGHSLHSSKY